MCTDCEQGWTLFVSDLLSTKPCFCSYSKESSENSTRGKMYWYHDPNGILKRVRINPLMYSMTIKFVWSASSREKEFILCLLRDLDLSRYIYAIRRPDCIRLSQIFYVFRIIFYFILTPLISIVLIFRHFILIKDIFSLKCCFSYLYHQKI